MALIGKENLSTMMEKRSRHRLNHVGTKLNEAELKEFTALVDKWKQTPSELIRGLVLREIQKDKDGPLPSPEMIEIVGTRLLLVNTIRPLLVAANAMPGEYFDRLLEQVAGLKVKVAQDLVHQARQKP